MTESDLENYRRLHDLLYQAAASLLTEYAGIWPEYQLRLPEHLRNYMYKPTQWVHFTSMDGPNLEYTGYHHEDDCCMLLPAAWLFDPEWKAAARAALEVELTQIVNHIAAEMSRQRKSDIVRLQELKAKYPECA